MQRDASSFSEQRLHIIHFQQNRTTCTIEFPQFPEAFDSRWYEYFCTSLDNLPHGILLMTRLGLSVCIKSTSCAYY